LLRLIYFCKETKWHPRKHSSQGLDVEEGRLVRRIAAQGADAPAVEISSVS